MTLPTLKLASMPTYISRWLGYRDPNVPLKKHKLWQICFWSFIGAWLGIAVLEIIGTYSPQLQAYHSPMIIASFGASAVLLYGAIDAPLSQPRNAFFGHAIGALVGVIISKLFVQIPNSYNSWSSEDQKAIVHWVAGATAMALALVFMQLTTTVHPPGGATALIACVDDKVMSMGWYYIGVVVMSACIQIIIACLVNNVDRKYPSFWWRPVSLPLRIDPANLATALPSPAEKSDSDRADTIVSIDDDDDDNDNDNNSHHRSSAPSVTHSSSSNTDNDDSQRIIVVDPSRPLSYPSKLLSATEIATLKVIHEKLCTAAKFD